MARFEEELARARRGLIEQDAIEIENARRRVELNDSATQILTAKRQERQRTLDMSVYVVELLRKNNIQSETLSSNYKRRLLGDGLEPAQVGWQIPDPAHQAGGVVLRLTDGNLLWANLSGGGSSDGRAETAGAFANYNYTLETVQDHPSWAPPDVDVRTSLGAFMLRNGVTE